MQNRQTGGPMYYGDEHFIEVEDGFDPEALTQAQLDALFCESRRITAFETTPDHNFIHDLRGVGFAGSLCYRIDPDRMIEINNEVLKSPAAIRNRVADVISFQFVSTVKRSEFLGTRKNVHDLGPALLVSVVPNLETTYRVPRTNVQIRHVVVHTTLSNLMERLSEQTDAGLAAGNPRRASCPGNASSSWKTCTATPSGHVFICR